jgi:hypothetical protein
MESGCNELSHFSVFGLCYAMATRYLNNRVHLVILVTAYAAFRGYGKGEFLRIVKTGKRSLICALMTFAPF